MCEFSYIQDIIIYYIDMKITKQWKKFFLEKSSSENLNKIRLFFAIIHVFFFTEMIH